MNNYLKKTLVGVFCLQFLLLALGFTFGVKQADTRIDQKQLKQEALPVEAPVVQDVVALKVPVRKLTEMPVFEDSLEEELNEVNKEVGSAENAELEPARMSLELPDEIEVENLADQVSPVMEELEEDLVDENSVEIVEYKIKSG
ncbi:MAG: hypothetical protein KDD62_03640, partial [Bdellovibrionales bacterium]|nr:hypothetical protein [Bdellovibrionales bacterium]